MAGGGNTGKAISAAANKAGAGGRHEARPYLRERIAGRRENPVGKSSGVQGDEGGREASGVIHESLGVGDKVGSREASGVAENPRGYCQEVGEGVELPQGIDTPGVAELSQGEETPVVTTEGEGVPEEDGPGRGEERTPPTTQATKARGDDSRDEESMGGLRTAAPPLPHQGMAVENNSTGTLLRHSAGTDGARPEHSALACRKYGLLAPMGTAVNT